MTIYVRVSCPCTRTTEPFLDDNPTLTTVLEFTDEEHFNYYFSNDQIKTDGSINNEPIYNAFCEGLERLLKNTEWSPCGKIKVLQRMDVKYAVPVMPLLKKIESSGIKRKLRSSSAPPSGYPTG